MLELAQLLMSLTGLGLPLGIMLLVAGRVKFRNELDTLTRCLSAFFLSVACYWLIGSGLYQGPSLSGLVGLRLGGLGGGTSVLQAEDLRTIFLFVVPSILATSALAERGSFTGGNILAIIVAILVVPISAHWAWKTGSDNQGWLASRGFTDDGGAIVIFTTAGFVALASSAAIGPRLGLFPGPLGKIMGHSPTFHALGMLIVVASLATVSTAHASSIEQIPQILFNVLLGASFAAISALVLLLVRRRKSSAVDLITASLAGAIAIAAFAQHTHAPNAALTGVFAGTVTLGLRRMLAVLELDDPGDLIAAFLSGGVTGGLLLPLLWAGGSGMLINRLVMQTIGIAAIGLWAFGITFFATHLINRIRPLRVAETDEARGLSRVHFDIQSEPDFLVAQMNRNMGQVYGARGDDSESFSQLSDGFSRAIIRLRHEIIRSAERIQATCDVKKATVMLQRIRLAEDTLRVKSEDILLLLESALSSDRAKLNATEFQQWAQNALALLMEPSMRDLSQFARHLPLQADLEELEHIILAAADTVTQSAHQLEMIRDLADVQVSGFYSSNHICDLAELLHDRSSLLNALAELSSSPIQIDCPQYEGLFVSGDYNAFTRILSLGVEGAINRLTTREGDPVRIELREHASGNFVVLEILDTGTALSGRQVRAILDPISVEQGWADIGLRQILPLILLSRLVSAIGGEVTLSSEEGLGTLLHCRFRRREKAHQQSATERA